MITAPPADSYFLVIATIVLAILIILYLRYIYIVGPKFMKDKAPYDVTNLLRVYNIFQVICCSTFVIRSYQMGFDFRFIWKCESFAFLSDETLTELYIGTWLFLLLRLFEFVETIFFILRKKDNQASFLHVYHHVSTVILMWIFITYDTGELFLLNQLSTLDINSGFFQQNLWQSTMLRSTRSFTSLCTLIISWALSKVLEKPWTS